MSSHELVCTACGCLCDDIRVQIEGEGIARIENACIKGAAYLRSAMNPSRRAASMIGGRSVPVEEAIDQAARLFSQARSRLIFGLDSSTLEAQVAAIELAERAGAVIDGALSFSYGALLQGILGGDLPTGSLSAVKDNADLLIYWGSNPPHTHPRHLSKFTYYAYSEVDPAGWLPKNVKLACIDARDTEFSALCRPSFKVTPGGDRDFIEAVLREGDEEGDWRSLLDLVKESSCCVMFCGSALLFSLDNDLGCLTEMVQRFGQRTRISLIPMVKEANQRGFAESLYKRTGYVDRVSFAEGVSHGRQYSFLEQLTGHVPDCILIVGSDPVSSLPQSVMRNLEGTTVIWLGRFGVPTVHAADVVVPTAVPGLECPGTMLRMDGDEVGLTAPVKGACPTEEEVLRKLAERLA